MEEPLRVGEARMAEIAKEIAGIEAVANTAPETAGVLGAFRSVFDAPEVGLIPAKAGLCGMLSVEKRVHLG